MNDTINQLLNRKSIRSFTGERVKDEDLDLILKSASRAPNSINGQQISLVYTRDKDKLKKISVLTMNQKHVENCDIFVMFVIDFNRTNHAIKSLGEEQFIHKSIDGIITGAIDAGIMLSSLQTAAESLGYGTTAIGAVRANPDKFIELLELPKNTFPVLGTIIGVSSKEAKEYPLKPRVSLDSFAFEDRYNDEKVKKGVDSYEEELENYRKVNNMTYKTSYKSVLCAFYGKKHKLKIYDTLIDQGFEFKN